jgi:LPS O-antigen subunit length determinant protein (WzzB/FepE family)
MNDITLTLIEIFVAIFIESIILGFVFQMISDKTEEKMEQNLKEEMNNIEKQNKFTYEQLQLEIRSAKNDVINQIKESSKDGGK